MESKKNLLFSAFRLIAVFFIAVYLSGCSHVNPSPSTTKEWTIMLFAAADNDLEEPTFNNVNELELTGSSDRVNMVAQTDWWHHSGDAESLVTGEGIGRWYITKDTDMVHIKSTLVGTVEEANTGTAEAIRDFVVWAVANYPASKYMLIVGSHGSGWRKGREIEKKGFGQDYTTDPSKASIMDLADLKTILPAIYSTLGNKKLDVFGIDACLNGMVDVAYLLKDYADILIASEDVIPGDGYPYTAFAAEIVATPTMTARELALFIVAKYYEKYYNQRSSTLAALDLSKIDALADSVKALAGSFSDPAQYEAVRDIINSETSGVYLVQRYYEIPFRDLWDFCHKIIEQKGSDPAYATIAEKCASVKTAVEQAVIDSKYTSGADDAYSVAGSHGISIYLPTPQTTTYESEYSGVDFSVFTGWGNFLQQFN